MRVGRHGEHLDVHLLKLRIDVGEILELGRADEGEVGRIEEENRPLAIHIGVGDVAELALLVGGRLEGFEGGVEYGHGETPDGDGRSSEERRGGEECVSRCRYRWTQN